MLKLFLRMNWLCLLSLTLFACATTHRPSTEYRSGQKPHYETGTLSELQEGKRQFNAGYYRTALRILLPLACDCIPEAEYAVGYMYYYGLAVAQDVEVGYFWINRAASQGYIPAQNALRIMSSQTDPQFKPKNLIR